MREFIGITLHVLPDVSPAFRKDVGPETPHVTRHTPHSVAERRS